jgi:cardiolipin synthase
MDGRIARKFGMVTELGKIVDPAADKLTQAAMILCVSQKLLK